MYEYSEQDELTLEFRRERSVRRAAAILEAKQRRIRADLKQLLAHISLLIPASALQGDRGSKLMLLEDAAERLRDENFSQLILDILREGQ
ncbi:MULTISPECIES: hypothetical protein [unclassified Spirulina]|uniref:hypothetical protein n=1 Tax=unclassified Spirulina TaxID=2684457 RepID=UPI00194F52C5|nr:MULTISPECIES: hypothetical protein [Spirulina]MEA5468555.1 hypothetical protein [Spirulina sp. 06S082]